MSCFPGIPPPVWLPYFTAITSCLLCIVVTTGNSLIILSVIIDPLRRLRSPFTYFLVNLAVTDFIVGTLSLPIAAYGSFVEIKGKIPGYLASLLHVTYFISSTGSVLSLGAMCFDRYVSIRWPLTYKQRLTLQRCLLFAVSIWVFTVGISMLYFVIGFLKYLMVFVHVSILLTFVIVVMTYRQAYKTLGGNSNRMQSGNNIIQPEENAPQRGNNIIQPEENALQRRSNTIQLETDVVQQGSNIIQPESNAVQQGSNNVKLETNIFQINVKQLETNVAQEGCSTIQPEINAMQRKANTMRLETNTKQQGSNTIQLQANAVQQVQNNKKQIQTNARQQGSNTMLLETNAMRQGSSTIQQETNTTKREITAGKNGSNSIQAGGDAVQHGSNSIQEIPNIVQRERNAIERETNAAQQGDNTIQLSANVLQRGSNTSQQGINTLPFRNDMQFEANAMLHEINADQKETTAKQDLENATQPGICVASRSLLRERKVTRAFFYILFMFVCSYAPTAIIAHILQFCPKCACAFRHVLRDFQFVFVWANSAVNPIICVVTLRVFRQSIFALIRCRGKQSPKNFNSRIKGSRDSEHVTVRRSSRPAEDPTSI